MLPEKLGICHKSYEHLGVTLTMTYIGYFFSSSFFHDKLPESWLVVNGHLMKTVFPKFLPGFFEFWADIESQILAPVFNVEEFVFLGIAVASRIIHPDVVASINKPISTTLFSI